MKKIILNILITIALFSISNNTKSQITFDKLINLPEISNSLGKTASPPRDIIVANGLTFIYTFKGILVYSNGVSNYEGYIPFADTTHGRLALQYQNPVIYTPDVKLMAHDDNNNELYIVTPNLTIVKVNTDGFHDNLSVVKNTPYQVASGHNTLHGMSKIEFDNTNNRLYWFFRAKEQNLHSWGSFFGIYDATSSYSEIYSEYKQGDLENTDYNNLLTTFTYLNNEFYISRRHWIELWKIENNQSQDVTKFDSIYMEQFDNGKMMVVSKNGKTLLLTFPYRLYYDTVSTTTHSIYQIDLANPSSYISEVSPNKQIADAILAGVNDDLLVCYANNPDEHQLNVNSNHDISILHFTNGWFRFQNSIFTNVSNENDTNVYQNLNRPFKFILKSGGDILVSKKNDIAEITYNGSNYQYSNLYYAKDNFFNKGILSGSTPIVINAIKGIEYFNNLGHATKDISLPVFFTEYNPLARKLYFFNRLTADKSEFIVFNPLSNQIENKVEVDYPIGDLKFNSFQNQILVSQFTKSTGNGAMILVFDGTTGAYIKTISIPGYGYASRMFVSPNGKIFISVNMKYDQNTPHIIVLDATNYNVTLNIDSGLTFSMTESSLSSVYQAHFCFNKLNNKTYGTLSNPKSHPYFMNPYHNSYNSPYFAGKDPTDRIPSSLSQHHLGKFYSVDNNNLVKFYDDIELPSELICADLEDTANPSYRGTVYINYWSAYLGNKLMLFDCNSDSYKYEVPFNNNVEDITYSELTNSVYVYEHEYDNGPTPNRNIIRIHKVDVNGTKNEIWTKPGFAAGIFYNPYDLNLYLYYRAGDKFLGQQNAKIYTLNIFSEGTYNTLLDSVSLPLKNLTPAIFPMEITPHFNEYANKAYFPNGTHSSVSVIDFTAKEALALHFSDKEKVDWLSIPRLPSNSSTNWDEKDPIESVFDRNNFMTPYNTLELNHWEAQAASNYKSTWDVLWNHFGDANCFSYRGYTLQLNDASDNYIYMSGNIKDPQTSFPLYPQQENWIGYFIPGEQDIFDALGTSTLSKIDRIEHQDYWCEKHEGPVPYGPTGGNVGQIQTFYWVCEKHQTNIKYGDMVKLHSDQTGSEPDLIQWQNNGSLPREKIRTEPEYFSPDQTSAYTPFIIQLDYQTNPLELAAFVNDKCVGASALMPNDTTVFMRVYLDGVDPDSIVFKDWFGTKSSQSNIIDDYSVYNKSIEKFERRALIGKQGNETVIVSFKKQQLNNNETNDIFYFDFRPNPVNKNLAYEFSLSSESNVSLDLFDIRGVFMANLLNGVYPKGLTKGVINISTLNIKINNGIYFIRLKAGGLSKTYKLIIEK